ncbi:MAG TPA: P-type conjugative transfer protein TrbL [Caulobacteraceae bacterium]|jgi:type IV secretion system protein TrbL
MAAGVGTETPNELMVVFSNTVTAGFDAISGAVSGVFGLMIVLVVALTGIQWALSANREVLAAGFGKVLLIGAFAWLINDWQALSETIYDGFIEIGLMAGGSSIGRDEFLNPGSIVQQGWLIVKAIGETPAAVNNPMDIVGNLMDALILGIAMLGIMLAFAVLALQIIVALLEFKIVTLGGFVLLPFGIWSKSAFLAERPLGYVVSSGLKVLALAIVISGARTVFEQLIPSENPDIYEALTILVAALLLAMLAIYIPNLAAALVTGGPALGAGGAITGGLAVGGTAALAGAGLMKLGSMIPAGKSERAQKVSSSSRAAAGAQSGRGPSSPPFSPPSAGPSGGPPPAPRPSTPGAGATAAPQAAGAGTRPVVEGGRAAGVPGASPIVEPARPSRKTAAVHPGQAALDFGNAPAEGAAAAQQSPAAAAAPPTSSGHTHASAPASGAGGSSTAGYSGSAPAAANDAGPSSRGRRETAEQARARRERETRRSGALQAFFVANAGRSLMPADSVGALTPDLKREDS